MPLKTRTPPRNEFAANQRPCYVQKEVAIDSAKITCRNGVAAAENANFHDANDDQDAKDHGAHIAAYAQTVLPPGLADFTEVDDEAAADVGTLEKDGAGCTWVETITPRELLMAIGSTEALQNVWNGYWGYWGSWLD